MSDTGTLISTGYVARRLGCSLTAIKDWEREGRIQPAIRILGSDRRVWPISDLPQLEEQVASLLQRGNGRRGSAA